MHEFEIVHEEFHAGPGHSNTSLERVHAPVGAKVKGHCGEESVAGDDGLRAYVVQEEAPGAVGVLCQAWLEPLLAN